MCFTDYDYDWVASVYEKDIVINTKPVKCLECYSLIKEGDIKHTIHMEQHEECQICYDGECECKKDECCQCSNPTFGEEYDYHRCVSCNKFLKAVHDEEIDAGCGENESQPPLEMMIEYLQEGGEDEAIKYLKRAIKEYPDLKRSGYLGKIWNRMFV